MNKIFRLMTCLLVAFLLSSCGMKEENDKNGESLSADSEPVISLVDQTPAETESPMPETELSSPQNSSVAMLSYLASLTQEINASKNSRLFLEQVYSSLINNVNPEFIDERTQDYLSDLLDIIEGYRMISIKRERIQSLYEQKKAELILEAIQSPSALIYYVPVTNPLKLANMAKTAVFASNSLFDSVDTLLSDALDSAFMEEGWELDDEENETLHESRKQAFLYMIDIVRENDLSASHALSENDVNQFVSWKHNSNVNQRLQFFVSHEETYAAFGNYWLELAKCYSETGDHQKCLECMEKYINLQSGIFRKDHEIAETIPLAIASAAQLYSEDNDSYREIASRLTQLLLDNTDQNEWLLRYFAAQTYIDLYARSFDESFLRKAYDITLDNVNQLVVDQKQLNNSYLNDVIEIPISDSLSKDEQIIIKDYNKSLTDNRKTALPPIYNPLTLNCDLLFVLAEKLDIPSSEQDRISGILRSGKEHLFLDNTIDYLYYFEEKTLTFDASFDKSELTVPAFILSENSEVIVRVNEGNTTYTHDDWNVKKVDRSGGDFDKYFVTLTSKKAEKQKWSPDSLVIVTINNHFAADYKPLTIEFKVSNFKNLFLTSLVEFEQIKN